MSLAAPPPFDQWPPDVDHSPELQTIWWSQWAVATVFIVLRFYARIQKRYLGWDDTFMTLSWV